MATKLSNLPQGTIIGDDDLIYAVINGVSVKMLKSDFAASLGSTGADGHVGGVIEWTGTGLTFISVQLYWRKNNQLFYSNGVERTSVASDPTNDRIDLFYGDDSGDWNIKEGAAAPTPILPVVDDTETQVGISFTTIEDNATEPSDFTIDTIYDEFGTIAGGESDVVVTSNGTLNSTEQKKDGTKSIKFTGAGLGDSATFVFDSQKDSDDLVSLSFWVYLETSHKNKFYVRLYNASLTTQISDLVIVQDSTYGFNAFLLNEWQKVTIPASAFNMGILQYGSILMQNKKNGSTFFWDVVEIQEGNGGETLPSLVGGHTIQDNGTPKTDRANLNFIGATVTDNAGNDSTDITITSVEGVIETFTSSTSWVFNHGLNNQYPDIKCIDSLGFAFIPLDIEYVSTTQAVITHTLATAGKATADGGAGSAAPLSGTVYAGISSESVGIFYADNYATLQLAVDAIPARGGTLVLSNKDYVLTSTLVVDKPIIIEGVFNGTVITTSSATIDMIEFAHSDIVMRDIKLTNTHVLPTAGTGIKVTSGVVGGDPLLDLIGFRLDNLFIGGFYDNIHVVNSFDWSINLCQIFAAVRYNIYIENQHTNDAGDANITNSWITNAGRAVVAGIKHISGGGLKLTNVKFNSNSPQMLRCYDGDLPTTVIVMFSNCSFENFVTGGIRLTNTNNLLITGCQFASYLGNSLAIDIDNVNQTSIVGNQFRLVTNDDGISVVNSNNVTLLNTFSNSGSGDNFTESGNTNVLNLNP